jgi:histidinol-phosphate aminotransferase
LAVGLAPYVPGEQPTDRRYIKLNTNESPYPPAPGVLAAIQRQVPGLALYPDPDARALCRSLAALHGLAADQVYAGNGSDEVLAFAFAAFFAGKTLLAPDLTYSFYPIFAKFYGVDYRQIPVAADFSIDPQGLCAGHAVILANPNAPTSLALPLANIRHLARHCHDPGRVLLVDEAYGPFGGESAIPLIVDFDNLLVVRTFSKAHGLAGLRLGYALGQPALIDGLRRIRDCVNSYPVDSLAQAAAQAAAEDTDYLADTVRKVLATRTRFAGALAALGFTVLPSATNFVFARHPAHSGEALQAALRRRGVLVRRFPGTRTEDWLRISIGSDADMDEVLAMLNALIRP